MQSNNAPIGIFDSGVGGTSIWKEIVNLLPHESTIYLADSANSPYGNKSREEIIALSIKNTNHLLDLGCKLIVVACNTATTNAIKILRETFDIPFVGIEPAIKPAALRSQTKSIGILATKGTLSSELFHKTSQAFTSEINLVEVVGEGLVSLIESGKLNSEDTFALLEQYMEPMLKANIDHLVLGCTHYPYLIPQLKQLLPPFITIIDSGEAVARQTKLLLHQNHLEARLDNHSNHQLFTNGSVDVLKEILREIDLPLFIEHRTF